MAEATNKKTISTKSEPKKIEKFIEQQLKEMGDSGSKTENGFLAKDEMEETLEEFKSLTDEQKKELLNKLEEAELGVEELCVAVKDEIPVNEERMKKRRTRANSVLEKYYRMTVGRVATLNRISGFTMTSRAFNFIEEAADFAANNVVGNAYAMANGKKAQFHKWNKIDQEKRLAAQLDSLLYTESTRKNEDGISPIGSRDVINVILRNPSILKEVKENKGGQIESKFKKALEWQMLHASPEDKMTIYRSVERAFGENELESIMNISEEEIDKKRIKGNEELFNIQMLSEKDLFKDMPEYQKSAFKKIESKGSKTESMLDNIEKVESVKDFQEALHKTKVEEYLKRMGLNVSADNIGTFTEDANIDINTVLNNLNNMYTLVKNVEEQIEKIAIEQTNWKAGVVKEDKYTEIKNNTVLEQFEKISEKLSKDMPLKKRVEDAIKIKEYMEETPEQMLAKRYKEMINKEAEENAISQFEIKIKEGVLTVNYNNNEGDDAYIKEIRKEIKGELEEMIKEEREIVYREEVGKERQKQIKKDQDNNQNIEMAIEAHREGNKEAEKIEEQGKVIVREIEKEMLSSENIKEQMRKMVEEKGEKMIDNGKAFKFSLLKDIKKRHKGSAQLKEAKKRIREMKNGRDLTTGHAKTNDNGLV